MCHAQAAPIAIDLLAHAGAEPPDGRPRHYHELDELPVDFVFTLSDDASGEATPAWPGHPVTAHWRSTDPDQFAGDPAERRRVLIRTRAELERRLRLFMNLPPQSLDRMSLRHGPVSS